MDAKDFATGLRQLANWYEAHPDIHLPYDDGTGVLKIYTEPDTKERIAYIARTLGTAEKELRPGSSFLRLIRSFNGVRLAFVFDRAAVCTARVVGKRLIPAEPARPEREEDIIEWDCSPILSPPTHTDHER